MQAWQWKKGVGGAGGSQFRLGHDIKIIPIKCIFHVKRLSWWNNLNARTGLYGIARKQSAPCLRPPSAARGKQEGGKRVGETVGSLPSKLAAGQLLYYVIITKKSSKQNNIFVLQAKS